MSAIRIREALSEVTVVEWGEMEMEEMECLGGGFRFFYFHPYLEKIPLLTNIFQMG